MNKKVFKQLSESIKIMLNDKLKRKLGITYDEFKTLDFDEQQRLIEKSRQNNKRKPSEYVRVLVGYGADTIIVRKRRGERYISDIILMAGNSPRESRQRLEDRLDDASYKRPVAYIKKLRRKLGMDKTRR